MKPVKLFEEFINEKRPEWQDSDAPDANGRFRDLGIKDLAAWLIKTRKKDLQKITASLNQQVVFNRNEDPEYASKMEKVRKEVYRQLGREDLLEATMVFQSKMIYAPLKVGYKIELTNGQTAQIIRLPSMDEYKNGKMAFVMTGNGITAEIDPNKDIKQVLDQSELDKDMAQFMD